MAGTALDDLQLGVADEEGVGGAEGAEPVEAVPQFGDVGEEVALDDVLDGRHVGVLVQHAVVVTGGVRGGWGLGLGGGVVVGRRRGGG